jgi:hypothetical protein
MAYKPRAKLAEILDRGWEPRLKGVIEAEVKKG